MGMFGSSASATMAPTVDPSAQAQPLSWKDRAAIFMQALDGDFAGAQKMKQAPQLAAQRGALSKQIIDMLGGQPASTADQVNAPQVGLTPPTSAQTPAVPITDPRWARAALMAPQLGLDMNGVLKLQELNKPQYEEGVRLPSAYDPSNPSFIPKRTEGMAPKFQNGQLVSMGNIPGYTAAAADNAGAVAGAQEQQKASYDVIAVKLPDGTEVQLPRAIAAPMLAKQFAGGGMAAGFGRSQGPAAQAADVARSTAGAAADVNMPQALSTGNQALQLIDAIKAHPALNDRTGLKAMLPAIPGTQGADFDAMAAQLKGKVFLQAYGDLKGAGQITEVEGKKATEAIARLNQTQTKKGYTQALEDLRGVIQNGMARAQQQPARLQPQAGGGRGGSVSAPPSAIGYLRQHPELASQFDAKYGAGASHSVLGR